VCILLKPRHTCGFAPTRSPYWRMTSQSRWEAA
jgi:hypothetical protein